jgi:outer membrane lipoprotein-sorting protein
MRFIHRAEVCRFTAGLGWLAIHAILLPIAVGRPVSAHALDAAAEIVERADRLRRPAETFVWTATITTHEGSQPPQVNVLEVFVKGATRSLMRFVAPPRHVGRSLLALDRELWIYLPDAGKPVRIPLAQRLAGQVSNGDLARIDYAGDYVATALGGETVAGIACHRLELKGRTKDVTYDMIRYWVAQDGARPVKAEFYAATGTLLKVGTFGEFRTMGGRLLATRLVLQDAVRADRRSVLDFSDLHVRDLPDKYFTKHYMKVLD